MKSEAVREYQRQWRARNRERLNALQRAWRKENKEKYDGYRKKYLVKNKSRLLDYQSNYYQKFADERRAYAREFHKRNPGRVLAKGAERRAASAKATPRWANKFFIQEIYRLAGLRSRMLGFRYHVDHIVPLRSPIVCGLHVETNLRVVPAAENLRKKNIWWPDMPEQEKDSNVGR